MKHIGSALVRAQKEFGPALKTHTNPAFRSKYADLSACIEAVIDALNNNGIFLTQVSHESEKGVTIETIFVHELGEERSAGKLHVPATKQDAQGYGSALTYARRYSLMAACGIAPEDDDGHAASKQATKPAPIQNVVGQFLTTDVPRIKATAGAIVLSARVGILEETVRCVQERMQANDLIGAFELLQDFNDSEEKTFIWSRLSSQIRSAITNHSKVIKEAA